MAKKISKRVTITQDVPEQVVLLQRPPGIGLKKWVDMESARLRYEYPKPKETSKELGLVAAEIMDVTRHEAKDWDEKYQLAKLMVRELLGWASVGTANGVPFVERRQFPVSGYAVDAYDQDALYPL